MPGSEVRKKVLAYTERTAELAAAAVHSSSPGRKRGSNGGGSVRGGDDSKENLPLLLGAEDDADADLDFLEKGGEDRKEKKGKQKEERGGGSRSKMVHRGQVAEARHQHTAEVTAGGLLLRAPNRRDYDGPPHRTSMDGDNKLAAAVEVELVEGNSSSVHFADQASAKALIWSFVQKAVEEAQVAKWEGLVDAASVQTFVKRAVEEAHAAKWEELPDAAAVKALVERVVEETQAAKWEGLLDAAAIKRFVQQTVEEAQAAKWEGLPDATAIKSFVQRTVHEAQSEWRAFEDAALRNFIVLAVKEAVEETVKEAVEESVRKAVVEHHFSHPAPANGISALERIKLAKDTLAEHAALSRVLFPLALGFTIPFLLARRNARPSKEELAISNGVITGMAKEQAFTFLIETVCYVYLLVTHFLHTKGPRLSLTGRRTTSTLIGCLVTLWLLFYTYCIPDWLFKHWFWYITSGFSVQKKTSGFLVVNWILTVCIGWFSCFVREDRWMDG